HPVTGDAGNVLDHGCAAAEDAVDQSRFAHVRAAHDGEHGGGAECLLVFDVEAVSGQQGTVVVFELIAVESGLERGRPLLGLLVADALDPVDQVFVGGLMEFGFAHCESFTSSSTVSTTRSKSMSLVSSVYTPSAASRKLVVAESFASRPVTRSSVAAIALASTLPWTSFARRATRTSSRAGISMRTSASGATTAVMSRPSTTMPAAAAAMESRCLSMCSVLASTTPETVCTFADTSGLRISSVTSMSSTETKNSSGLSEISRSAPRTCSRTSTGSVTPRLRHSHAIARYMAPVSRYW